MINLKKASRCIALVLVLTLSVSAFILPTHAASYDVISDADQMQYYVDEFNKVVNAVKEERPGMTVSATGEVLQDADLEDDKMAQFANMAVANVFKNDSSLVADLFGSMNETETDDWQIKDIEYVRGEADPDKVPVSGEKYVSKLTTNFPIEIRRIRNESKKTTEIGILFPDTLLTDALNIKKSDMSKVFDLPTNTSMILTEDENAAVILEDGIFQLNDIMCTKAYVDIIYNDDLELISYEANITYTVKVNTYSMLAELPTAALKMLDSFGLELGELTNFNIVKIIMGVISLFTDFDPEESMSSTYVNYNVKFNMYGFDWSARLFGDTDNNGAVETADARNILRNAVGLDQFSDPGMPFFADLNFDGSVNPADARIALRIAVGLDMPFTSYAMRQEQLAGNLENTTKPSVPDTPTVPETPTEPDDEPDGPEVPDIPFT